MLNLSEHTERLARLVATTTGTSPDEVVREAVEQRARAAGVKLDRAARPVDLVRIDAITRRSASRPLLDTRSARDIRDEVWGDEAV